MTFADINKEYSKRVAEWIGKGYWVNAGTMSGTQGEIAHIDLTNGRELIRVLLEDGTEYDDENWYDFDVVRVIVGRVTDERVRIGVADRLGNTVWNSELETIEEKAFYLISSRSHGWYGTKEECEAKQAKHRERVQGRRDHWHKDRVFKGMEEKMLPFVRREVIGCKTAKAKDITKVEKVYNTNWNDEPTGVSYYVTVKGKRVRLGAREVKFANAR